MARGSGLGELKCKLVVRGSVEWTGKAAQAARPGKPAVCCASSAFEAAPGCLASPGITQQPPAVLSFRFCANPSLHVRWAMNKQGCTSVALSERGGRRPRHALVVQAQRQVAELSLPQLHQHASVTSFVLRGVAQAAG